MTTYCAPCISDLALVREAVTAVAGTACCAAHAVLLTHPHDAPGRRRARLSQLRLLAENKSLTAPVEDQPGLELLMHEYTLAGAMDMSGQPRPDGSPQPARDRGDRPARDERGPRGDSERGPRGDVERPGEPPREGGRSGKRRGRGRGDRGDRAQSSVAPEVGSIPGDAMAVRETSSEDEPVRLGSTDLGSGAPVTADQSAGASGAAPRSEDEQSPAGLAATAAGSPAAGSAGPGSAGPGSAGPGSAGPGSAAPGSLGPESTAPSGDPASARVGSGQPDGPVTREAGATPSPAV